MADLSALAYALRKNCASQGIHFPISHAHQLIAAALGHGTLAALQASSDVKELGTATHVILDSNGLQSRAVELGLAPDAVLVDTLASTLDEQLLPAVHRSMNSFEGALQELVDTQTFNNGRVSGELAMTNGGLDEIDMPLDLDDSFDLASNDDISCDIVGQVSVEQDPDKAYWGHEVEVEATLHARRVGRRIFADVHLEVTRAELRWFNEPDGEVEEASGELN